MNGIHFVLCLVGLIGLGKMAMHYADTLYQNKKLDEENMDLKRKLGRI
jgi:hypothetical protein